MLSWLHRRLLHNWSLNYEYMLVLIIILSSIRIYWLQVLVRDDYYYGIYRWRELGSLPQISREMYWLINRSLCWVAGNFNVNLARSLVLFCIVIPSALLIYNILLKLKYTEPVAFFTAAMVWVFPGQYEIPYFVNGSYTAESLLFMLLSFWSGLKLIENDDRNLWIWLVSTIFFYLWSVNVSELIIPCTMAIIFCYLFWGKLSRKALLLSSSIALLAAYHTYFRIINNGRDVVSKSRPLSFRGLGNVLLSFVDWCLPATGIKYIDNSMWYKFIVFTIIMIIIVFTIIKTVISYVDKGLISARYIYKEQLLWQMIFPFILFIAPLVVMAIAPWFNVRHAIFSAIGFYLILSLSLSIIVSDKKKIIAIIFMVICITCFTHDNNISKIYSVMNRDNADFLSFISTKYLPPNAQVVVVNMNVATSGHGYWSTGYLEYVLNRRDISGLIGKEFNLLDPFKKHEYSDGGMNGLTINNPIFMYRKNNNSFEQLKYFLQWKQNRVDSDYTIYKTDNYTGKITVVYEGKGLNSFLAMSKEMASKGVKRSDILWGGDFSSSDLKRINGI